MTSVQVRPRKVPVLQHAKLACYEMEQDDIKVTFSQQDNVMDKLDTLKRNDSVDGGTVAAATASAAAATIVSATTAECASETPAATVLTHPATAVTASVTRKTTSLALINSRSVRNTAELIRDYIVDRDLDIVCITETWLSTSDTAVINALTPEGYNFRHLPRTDLRGGGVGMLYKSSFLLCSSTPLPATSFKGLEVVLCVGKVGSVIRIVTV